MLVLSKPAAVPSTSKVARGCFLIVAVILVGQVAMVEVPGIQQFFNVVGLSLTDWVIIIAASSLVLWVREGWSLLKGLMRK